MILSKLLKGESISGKMERLYKYVNTVSSDMSSVDKYKQETLGKISTVEFSQWYAEKIKIYEELINEAEQRVGLKNVCSKGCCECCKQAIYINPAEYRIIAKYIEQLEYSQKEYLKKQVRESLEIIKQAGIPMKVEYCSQEEQNRVNEIFFSCNIRCPFLSQENACLIYDIRPCVCWSYRNYKDKNECQTCFNPRHSCAFVTLDRAMTEEMYTVGQRLIRHSNYYLLVYAIGKMLFIV